MYVFCLFFISRIFLFSKQESRWHDITTNDSIGTILLNQIRKEYSNMEYRILEQLDEIKSILTGKMNDNWMTIKEVTQYSNLSESTIRRASKRGVLKASQSTGRLLFKKSNVDKWLQG